MKKIFFSLLAIAAIASCAKTEAVYTEAESEIKLAPVTALQTKANVLAAIDGTEYPTAENFDVYGYWKNGDATNYTDGQSFFGGAVEFKNKGNYWGGVQTYYWPKNGTLRFAAYSPSSLDVEHDQVGDTFTKTGYTQPSNTAETYDFLVAPTSAPYTAMTAAEKVSVVFEHALSWITIKVVAKDAVAQEVFTIKNITINGVNTTADFEASMLGKDRVDYESWSKWGTPAEYVVFDGEQGVTGEATVIENTAAGTLVIPQETTTLTVTFDQKGVNGTLDTPGMTETLDLVLDTDATPWEPGKHYNYTLVFGLNEILINPSVSDWEEVEVGNLDVDAANVSTEAQLVAALANGGKITLQNNIALSENKTLNVAAGNTVVLDLNGNTLSGNSNTAANYDMILVKGDLTVINGKVTTESAVNNGWNSMTTIFDVTAGGMLSLNNVEAINLGGTDMAFVAHLNNWGEVTLNVDNSYLEANYVAVRVFNSGYDKNNVSIYNSTLKGGNYAFWVHNYTAADFGSEAKAESQQALLNFDILNGTNTFVGKNLTPLRYGMTDSIYCDVDGFEAVPAATQDALNDAIATGGRVRLAAGEYTMPAGKNFTAETELVCEPGTIFTGTSQLNINGATIVGAEFSNPSGTVISQTINGVFKGCTFTGGNSLRYCYAGETVVFEDCVFDGSTYGVHFDGGANEVIFRNCTISGFNAIAAAVKMATFEGCTFKSNGKSGYNGINLWGAAKMIGCEFTFDGSVANEWVDCIGATMTYEITNCTVNGVALTDANAADYSENIFSRNHAVVKINGVDCTL